jgi:hypothetical protein
MKRIVLIFGLISGALMAVFMFATMPFIDKIGFDKGLLIGYANIVFAFDYAASSDLISSLNPRYSQRKSAIGTLPFFHK